MGQEFCGAGRFSLESHGLRLGFFRQHDPSSGRDRSVRDECGHSFWRGRRLNSS